MILYNYFSLLLIYGGLGLGSWNGLFGLGFLVDRVWVGVCGVGPSGFLGLWLSM